MSPTAPRIVRTYDLNAREPFVQSGLDCYLKEATHRAMVARSFTVVNGLPMGSYLSWQINETPRDDEDPSRDHSLRVISERRITETVRRVCPA
jgi:hypothetical protein